jgi:hypothetical protein
MTPPTPAPPTARQVEGMLKLLLNDLMSIFNANQIDGMTINSIGTILANIKFDGTEQSAKEVAGLVHAAAEKQAEDIKVMLLRASVVN